jgi:hypothetical protein
MPRGMFQILWIDAFPWFTTELAARVCSNADFSITLPAFSENIVSAFCSSHYFAASFEESIEKRSGGPIVLVDYV